MNEFSDAELAAFLDEALPPSRASHLEHQLRSDEPLRNRLIEIRGRENAGLHTLSAIWRRGRLSCPTRGELGEFLLGSLSAEAEDYIRFHLDQIGCRYCQANLDDLQAASREEEQPAQRRRRYFQTSAGYLSRGERSS